MEPQLLVRRAVSQDVWRVLKWKDSLEESATSVVTQLIFDFGDTGRRELAALLQEGARVRIDSSFAQEAERLIQEHNLLETSTPSDPQALGYLCPLCPTIAAYPHNLLKHLMGRPPKGHGKSEAEAKALIARAKRVPKSFAT